MLKGIGMMGYNLNVGVLCPTNIWCNDEQYTNGCVY